jgi:hypothetical protein
VSGEVISSRARLRRRPAWYPSPEQELLLQAALLPDAAAERSWVRWREAHASEPFDVASFRMLPLVYRNLARLGSGDSWMGRLKGVYGRSWFVNQMLFHRAAAVVRRLEAADIPTLLLKGAGLSLAHYRDMGARPMDDVDVAVPLARASEAIAVLRSAGMRPELPLTDEHLVLRHAESLATPDGHTIDLHWSLLWQAGDDDEFWDAAVPATLLWSPTRTLSATDHILQVCAHGAYWGRIHPMRWVADVHTVMRSAAPEIDWERLLRLAVHRELTLALHDALAYIDERFDTPMPDDLLGRLRSQPVRAMRRAAHFVAGLRPSPGRSAGMLLLNLDIYRAHIELHGRHASATGFIQYLQRNLRVVTRRQLAARIMRSSWPGEKRGP